MPSFVLGIDFGTTNSVMAVTREDGVDVLSNDIGNNKTPSVVHIDPLKPWVRQVGEAAQRLEIGDPQHTIRNVKRILGLPPECVRQIKSVDPIKVVNSADGDAVSIKLSDNVNCSPEEVVAMLLLELKKAAKPQLGEEVSKVSIAVPCFFTAAQRQAITSAANLADLEVAEMVNETTAAAAAYAFDRGYSKTVLMVDVGGGGSCVSVVRVEGNEVTVRASSTRMPGGENFDSAMLEYLKKALIQKQGKGISEQRSLEILRSQWVEAKRKLSQLPETIIQTYLPELKVDFRKVVTRTEFENACESLFQKIINAIKITIERAKVDAEKLDDVVLVGGGSRIPKLRELIETTIGDKLCKALNPDEAVAVGAALIGNGKVLIKQEVLGLFTRIRITCKDSQVDYRKEQDRQWSCCTLLPCTYSNFTCNSSAELEIEQGHTEKSLVSICKMAAPSKLDCINFDRRGQLNISVRNKNKKSIYLRGCIPDGKLQNLREIMQSHVKSALEEVDRVLAKNALEDVLRRVKSDESLQSSPFQSKYEELKDFCLKQLDWLDQNSCANKQEFEEIRVVVETREKTFRDECEQEMCRQKEKTEFESVLRTALVTEVSDNEFQQQASSLKDEWNMELKWLSQNQDTSIEEYRNRKEKVIYALNILTEECRRAVIKKQRDAAETKLRMKIRSILLIAKEEHGDDSIDQKFKCKLRNLHKFVDNWLKKNPDASEEALNIIFNKTEQDLVDAQRDCKRLKDERESERIDSKRKAECKVLEGINLKISEFQIVRDAAVALVSKSEQLLEWLKDHPHEESHSYRKVIDEMKQEFDNLKKKKAAEGARQEIKHKLQNILEEALKSDEPLHTLAKDCVLWLEKNPQATKEKMEKLINDVNDVLRELGNARKSFEDTTAANARANEIVGCVVKDISLRFDASAYQNEDMCVNGSGYCPKEYTVVNMNEPRYTRPVPEAKGPVECNGLLTADGPKPAGSVTLPEAFAVARTHARRLRPDGPDPSAGLAPHNDISVFQCLADAMAVRALQDAAGAGLIALLVCKAAAAGRELVSLAVRFVDESGQPVERLLVVKELGRDGEAANCKHLLVTPFLGLCKRAQLDWREKLLGVCTVGAGAEGKAFIGHMAELNNNKAPQELDCGSVPLDWRFMEKIHKRATTGRSGAAPACQKLSEFFSTIDALRSMFAVGGRWYQSLQEHCRTLQPGDNPWLTYTSSCCFVMAERTKLPWALTACEQDPALRLLSSAILRQINDKSFLICLETCTMLFKSVGGYDDSLVSSESNPSDLIVSLERAFLFNLPQAFKSVCKSSKMRCDVMDANEISEICEDLGKSTLDDWKMNWGKFVFPLLHAVCDFLQLPQHNKPTTRSYQKNRLPSLPQDLDNFFRYFPERFSSLQAMLCGMPRTQLAKEYPFLFKALLGTLTSPLLPPRGKRAQQQLRDSVFYAAGLPALVGPTIIIMSMSDLCHEDKALNLIWEEGRKTLNGKR